MKKQCSFMVAAVVFLSAQLFGQTGDIRGRIVDSENQQPMCGVNILIRDTELGAASDDAGQFLIHQVPVGIYTLICSNIGYEGKILPDVIVKTNRSTFINVEMNWQVIEGESVTITA